MQLPLALLESLEGLPAYNRQLFVLAHQQQAQAASIRFNTAKQVSHFFSPNDLQKISWAQNGYSLSRRPSFTLDPIFHAGAYYVQEASSMFVEQAITQLTDLSQPLTVLDMCAAPGGKSTHLQSLLSSQSVLVANEVIRQRAGILVENITKWGAGNCIITNNDPADFSPLQALFDVIVVDAPCSGSGLFRKNADALNEWSEENVVLCSQRQQRILADVWPALKPGGLLIYSTCSYSAKENEEIADWLTIHCQAENAPLAILPEWGIVETTSAKCGNKGYRFYPYLLNGEGFYLSCFRKEQADYNSYSIGGNKQKIDKKQTEVTHKWLDEAVDCEFYQHEEQLFCMPQNTLHLFLALQKKLHIRKAGIKVGDWIRDEIIPDHALAMSLIYNKRLPMLELEKDDALQFLRKTDFAVGNISKGWMLVTHNNLPLGWIKSLGNRINNYYPKEWRIRK